MDFDILYANQILLDPLIQIQLWWYLGESDKSSLVFFGCFVAMVKKHWKDGCIRPVNRKYALEAYWVELNNES